MKNNINFRLLNIFKKNARSLLIISLYVFLDQVSKFFVGVFVSEDVGVLPFLNLINIRNTGVSFGMFRNWAYSQYLFSIFAIVVSMCLFYMIQKAENIIQKHCYLLIIGGAIGNTIDRIRLGGVVDFIDFYVSVYHYPAFNIADSLIFLGVVGMLFERQIIKFLEKK